MAGNNNYAIVINFYEKIDPPPRFQTFVEGWHNLGKYVRQLDYFVATQLHRNIDSEGKFKYMNFATFNDKDRVVMRDMTEPSIELLGALSESHGPPGLQTNYPGAYHETRTSGGPVAPDIPAKLDSAFLISAFRATADFETLQVEDNIDGLCGLSTIAECAKEMNFEIGPWAFYKRFTPVIPFQPFDFVFRCELQGLSPESNMEVVRRVNEAPTCDGVERSYTSLYAVDKENVVLPAET